MSCNGCRVLRKGCGDACVLRASLRGIESPDAQAHATLFLAKFFGRSDLLSLIASVHDHQRPALFHSLLYEACGRTVNPVNGAVGLLSTGNWHLCEAAVETVLTGGSLLPIPGLLSGVRVDESSECFSTNSHVQSRLWVTENGGLSAAYDLSLSLTPKLGTGRRSGGRRGATTPFYSADESDLTTLDSEESGGQERKLLNLFV